MTRKISLRLRSLFRPQGVEDAMQRELRFHLEQQIEENLAAGMTPEEARYAAIRVMGGVAQVEEECRDARGVRWWDEIARDVRYACRSLAHSPVFAAVAILSLALGTGANTAVFSVIDTVMLQNLPVRHPEELVVARTSAMKVGNFNVSLTLTNQTCQVLTQAKQIQGLATIAAVERLNVGNGSATEVLPGAFVSGNFLELMGVKPALGRALRQTDNRREADANGWPAMISYRLWQRKFAGSRDVLGQHLSVNTVPFTVIGVLPRTFRGLEIEGDADLVMPNITTLQVDHASASAGFPGPDDWLGVVVLRLKPGVTLPAAQAELTVLLRQAMAAQKRTEDEMRTIVLTPAARGLSWVRTRYSNGLTILMAVVGVVMLIASANLASLMLVRASNRQREICIRMSLGSSRSRIVRQLLIEALVISLLGTAAGLLFAGWAQRGLAAMVLAHDSSSSLPFHWNWQLIAFVAGLALLNAALFGLAPALRTTRVNAGEVLRSGRSAGHVNVARTGRWLVASQIALSLALVAGAVLLLKTLANLYSVDLGFNHRDVMLFTTDPHLAGYEGERTAAFYRQVLERTRVLPGVEAVSMIRNPLLGRNTSLMRVAVPGYTGSDQENRGPAWIVTYKVGPDFFSTMQMPLLAGRDFTDAAVDRTGKVAVINATMAKHYFPGRNPIGQRIAVATETPDVEIIGVAADTHYFSAKEDKQDVLFTPLLTPAIDQATVLVRAVDTTALAHEVRGVVRAIDANVPVYDTMNMNELLDDNLAQQRMIASLSGFFGGLALVLSAIGVYGVLAYSVGRRTAEIGIRMALGATRREIVGMVFRETATPAAAGIAGGLLLTVISGQFIRTLLFGVSTADMRALAAAVGVLVVVVLAASLVPLRRAVSVDPMQALREE